MKSMVRTLVCTALTLSVSVTVFAHSGATGVVKERMQAMKALGKQTKLVVGMFKGKAKFEKKELINAADLFVIHGNKMLALFPDTEHSRTGKTTEALPEIWEDSEGFASEVQLFIERSELLQQTASVSDDEKRLRSAFKLATDSCSSCHKAYRKPTR